MRRKGGILTVGTTRLTTISIRLGDEVGSLCPEKCGCQLFMTGTYYHGGILIPLFFV